MRIQSLFTVAIALLFLPVLAPAQSAYDPPTTQTFTQATAGMSTLHSYSFGTAASNNVRNLTQLASSFNPYGIAGTIVVNDEWERYQPINSANFAFSASALNLTATIPAKGGLFAGGINSGQIWSKQTYMPGANGQNVLAFSARMKIPGGVGMWPAFWLYSVSDSDGSEIDISEFIMESTQCNYYWSGNDHGPGVGSTIYTLLTNPWYWDPGTDFAGGFHDYQLIWTPDATFKYVDDQLVEAQYFKWTSSQPAQLGVNLAVGSSMATLPGLIPKSLSEFPSAVQLESITILGSANPPSPTTPAPTTPAPTAPSPVAPSPVTPSPVTPSPVTPSPVTTSTASVTFTGLDTTTQGAWSSKYGADGYTIANDATKLPSYATVSMTGASTYTWGSRSPDPRALQASPGAINNGFASAYQSSSYFNMNVSLTDGNTHQVALYLLDWDSTARVESVAILDATTNQPLYTRSFSGFHNGQYAVWNITGNVIIQVTTTVSASGVVSGVFFGTPGEASAAASPVTSAVSTSATVTYAGLDTSTQGDWTGKYGNDGYIIANDANNPPAYATAAISGGTTYTWGSRLSDPRALQSSPGTGSGIASAFNTSTTLDINIDINDGNTHRIALYLLDWDSTARVETINILDAATRQVLSTQTYSGFHNGEYAIWNVAGNVIIQASPTTFGTAVISGIFFN